MVSIKTRHLTAVICIPENNLCRFPLLFIVYSHSENTETASRSALPRIGRSVSRFMPVLLWNCSINFFYPKKGIDSAVDLLSDCQDQHVRRSGPIAWNPEEGIFQNLAQGCHCFGYNRILLF